MDSHGHGRGDGLSVLAAAADPGDAGRPALILPGAAAGELLTYADLGRLVAATSARLARAGVGPGARVALQSPNRLGVVLAIHALLALGAVLVPLHPRLTASEAAALLADARPDLVLREPDLAALESDLSACAQAGAQPPPAASLAPPPDGDLAIVYTSGTTGRPKGAVLTRRAFIAAATASAANLGFRDDDRWLLCMPLCHVGGLSIVTRCLLARRAVILVPRFEPDAVLAAVAAHGATLLSVVPTMLAALLDADGAGVLARLRAILVGGAAAPARLLAECARRGVPALTTYGLTEACSQVTSQRPRDPRTLEPGSGRPLPGIEVRIAAAGADGAGRIQVRSPALFRGYWRGPEAPAEPATDAEGWLDTGDVGLLDEAGRLHVLARRTDLIVTGGENVYPVEVERALEACAGVARALVFGVPDERWGQVVAAAVVLEPGAGERLVDVTHVTHATHATHATHVTHATHATHATHVTHTTHATHAALAALAADLQDRLAPHKRPRRLCVVGELPVTAAGKLDRAGAATQLQGALLPLPPPAPPAAG